MIASHFGLALVDIGIDDVAIIVVEIFLVGLFGRHCVKIDPGMGDAARALGDFGIVEIINEPVDSGAAERDEDELGKNQAENHSPAVS